MIQIENGVLRVDIRSRRRWAAIGALVGALLILPAAPIGASPAREAPQGAQPGSCGTEEINLPLELNTVAAGGLWKTLAMEKESFHCVNTDGSSYVRDVETFIEVVEKGRGTLVEATVQVATCFKQYPGGGVECKWNAKTLGNTATPVANCRPLESQPYDPVEMNTTVNQTGTTAATMFIKTIKVEKDVWECGDPATSSIWADLYVFSELVETQVNLPNNAGKSWRPAVRQFFGVVCYKDWQHGLIDRCARFVPSRLIGD